MANSPQTDNLESSGTSPFVFRNNWAFLAIALFLAANMSLYLYRIGPQEKSLLLPDRLPSSLSDLYSPWRGSRELLLHHRNPYSADVTRDIQIDYYGRPLTDSPEDPKDQQRFAYPVYVAFLLAPITVVPFATVYQLAKWVLPVIFSTTIFAWLSFIRARLSLVTILVIGAMTFTAVPVARALNLQQLTIVVSALMAFCAIMLARGRFWLAGTLLALASIKPQLTILLVIWLIGWSLSAWRERKGLLWGFGLSMSALLVGAEFLLPGWIVDFARGLVAYRQYAAAGGILLKPYVPGPLSIVLAALVLALAAVVCWRTRDQGPGSVGFVFTFCLILVVTVLAVPAASGIFNQVLFLPAILLALTVGKTAYGRSRRNRAVWTILWTTVILPWLAAVALVLVWWLLPASALHRVWGLPLYAAAALPFSVLAFLVFLLRDVFAEGRTNISSIGKTAG